MANITASPEEANKLIEQVLSGQDVPVEAPPERTLKLPPDTSLELPCGLLTLDGLFREAEVRELNGYDEEALAKVGHNPSKFTQTLLERGVVRIGEGKPSKTDLDSLAVGDVDALVLAIRKATYGGTISVLRDCPHCGQETDLELDLTEDIEVIRLEEASDQRFEVQTKRGTARVRIPDWGVRKEMLSREGATSPELTTILLKNCVESLDGVPVFDESSVRGLPITVRSELIEAIADRAAGPQLAKAKKECTSCGEDIALPLTVMSMFLG